MINTETKLIQESVKLLKKGLTLQEIAWRLDYEEAFLVRLLSTIPLAKKLLLAKKL